MWFNPLFFQSLTVSPNMNVKQFNLVFKKIIIIIYVLILGLTGFLSLHRLSSSCGECGVLSRCGVRASHCDGFSCCTAWTQEHLSLSSCGSWAPERRLSSCGLVAPRHVGSSRIRARWNPCLLHWQADSLPLSC